jgi:hypothetical protein
MERAFHLITLDKSIREGSGAMCAGVIGREEGIAQAIDGDWQAPGNVDAPNFLMSQIADGADTPARHVTSHTPPSSAR